MAKQLVIDPKLSIRSQIMEFYRSGIRSGEFPQGYVLPPARKIAAELGTAEANVHHAFAGLAREGLIARRPKIGSVVIEPARIHRVAFFLPELYTRRGERFTQPLVETLEASLRERGIPECQVIYDSGSGDGWKLLKRLAERRQIQAVVVRSLSEADLERFSHLPIPFAAITHLRIPTAVSFYSPQLAEAMVEALAVQNCRTAGILAPSGSRTGYDLFQKQLVQCAERAGIEVRPEWIFTQANYGGEVIDIDHFAYRGIETLLTGREHPEGVMLFSDDLVAGATMALYARRLRVPEHVKLAIHRTVENPVIFPFECMLVEQSLREVTRQLAAKLIDRFEGRSPEGAELSIRLRKSPDFLSAES